MPDTTFRNYAFAGYLPTLFAPDPGGTLARQEAGLFHVVPLETPVQHSPPAYWNPGTPYPGPPAAQQVFVDLDSRRWWGRTGQGRLIWSQAVEYGELPPMIPFDLPQHIDTFQRFWGGYPSLARNRPPAFGDTVPTFTPAYTDYNFES